MNLLALRGAIRTRLGVPTTDALYPDATCTALANAAVHFIEAEEPWRYLEKEQTLTIVGGTPAYNVSSDYRSSVTVTDANGWELDRVDAAMLRKLIGATGAPKMWDTLGAQVRVAPTAAATLTHTYIGGEVDLAADTDIPLLPVVYHQAIVEYAAYLAFRRGHQTPEAGAAKAAYDEWIAQMRKEQLRYSKDVPLAPVAPAVK